MPVQAIRRRLASAGFGDVRTYWPWPPVPPHQYFVPLELDGPARRFLESQPVPRAPVGRVMAAIRRGAWTALRAAGMLTPVLVVATRASEAGPQERPVSTAVMPWPLAVAAPLLADDAASSRSGAGPGLLLRAPGFRATNAVIGLVFPDGDGAAQAVVKTTRARDGGRRLAAEAAALRAVAAEGPIAGVPHVLGAATADDVPWLVETFLDGAPVHELASPAATPRLAALAPFDAPTLQASPRRAPPTAGSQRATPARGRERRRGRSPPATGRRPPSPHRGRGGRPRWAPRPQRPAAPQPRQRAGGRHHAPVSS
jgi:hypothetical protein